MRFRAFLGQTNLDLSQVCVILHTPVEKHLRRVFPSLAVEEPALFDAYQNNHPAGPEATLKVRPWMVSFVNTQGTDFVLVGVYRSIGWRDRTLAELDADPRHAALQARYGMSSFTVWGAAKGRQGRAEFHLEPTDVMGDLRGRLLISHQPTQSYLRLGDTFDAEVVEITRTAHFSPPVPAWQDFILSAAEVRNLPHDWALSLAQWRGVYLIVDQADGARYVGSACGQQNILGRWREHCGKDRGVTVELARRDPARFRFSILQRTDPDLPAEEVIVIEQTWKRRLDTIGKHGLNLN